MIDGISLSSAASMLASLSTLGRDPRRGGYSRPAFSRADQDMRAWFIAEAQALGLEIETDRNGGLWAWQDIPGGDRSDAVVTGSHLDSVPGGGAFDGPLGVVSGLAALGLLHRRGHSPRRALAVTVFPEEEGSRFGLPCLGSGLMTGTVDPARTLRLRDDEGNTYADLARANGIDPERIGPDPDRLARIGAFVELHVEQGRGLIDLERPIAIGRSILGHGRWRIRLTGQGNHAGTTAMVDRRDALVTAAKTVLVVQDAVKRVPDARGTVGKIVPTPGGANVIASSVDLWLDVRHPDDAVVRDIVSSIELRVREIADAEGCASKMTEESYSPTVSFDRELRNELAQILPGAPLLPTGAGHDAGVMSPFVPTAMLFVRNPSGVSHSPEEQVEEEDVQHGVEALASVLADLSAKLPSLNGSNA